MRFHNQILVVADHSKMGMKDFFAPWRIACRVFSQDQDARQSPIAKGAAWSVEIIRR